MEQPHDNFKAIAEAQLQSSLATFAGLLSLAQQQGWLTDLEFNPETLSAALFVFGTIAKRIGYATGEVTDENLEAKMNSLVLALENIVGKDYISPPHGGN